MKVFRMHKKPFFNAINGLGYGIIFSYETK